MRNDLGARLRQVRASRNQQDMAELMGIAKRTYASYERNERVPDALMLKPLLDEGWNANWLISGNGSERLEALNDRGFATDETADTPLSQPPRFESLTLAIQLAEEALDGGRLEPADYAQLVSLIHDALVNGLPSAQVLAFARPAARGIGETEHGRRDVGGSGKKAAR
ncbi:helix-turn-helix transcriptional regulator [Xanthomonas nasturtii]